MKKWTKLLNKCLIEENVPYDWNDSTVVLLRKKDNHNKLEHYQPINLFINSLYRNVYKLLMKIITKRLSIIINKCEAWAGFRKGYGSRNHLTMKLFIEKSSEYNEPVFLAFVQFEKAFESVEIWAVLHELIRCGIARDILT